MPKTDRRPTRLDADAEFVIAGMRCHAYAVGSQDAWSGHVTIRRLTGRSVVKRVIVKGVHSSLSAFLTAARAAATEAATDGERPS